MRAECSAPYAGKARSQVPVGPSRCAKSPRRQREVTQVVTLSAPNAQDCVALAEIELCGELMIAASTAREDRLSPDRIDEVLNVKAITRAVAVTGAVATTGSVTTTETVAIPRQYDHRG
jgi:hypothetical protein